MPETHAQRRLLLTMVERDVPLAQSLVSELRKGHGLGVDVALVSDRFDTVGARYVRSSLAQGMNRSSAALCLLGEDTLRDPWVVWCWASPTSYDGECSPPPPPHLAEPRPAGQAA